MRTVAPGARRRAVPIGAALALVAIVLVLLLPSSVHERAPGVAGSAVARISSLIDAVGAARAARFDAKDQTGAPLATLKVVPAGPPRSYVGVYHVRAGSGFDVRLATSTDLRRFSYVRTLARGASQPTIAPTSAGGFLAGWEKEDPGNRSHLELATYSSLADLLAGRAARTIDVPRSLSSRNEGTPSFYAKPDSRGVAAVSLAGGVEVGFHYYDAAARADRNARAELSPAGSLSSEEPADDVNDAFPPSIRGNIGDRDEVDFEGHPFTIVEAESRRGDFGSFRVYLYDQAANRLHRLDVRTPAGSVAFGNPALTILTDPAGRRALLVSLFVLAQGARGHEAGPLIYYREF